MNTNRVRMSLKLKMGLVTGLSLILVMTIAGWVLLAWTLRNSEKTHREKLELLATSSRMMIHSAAEEYARAHHYGFLRATTGETSGSDQASVLERRALEEFADQKESDVFDTVITTDTGRVCYVFAPASVKDECVTCHASYGMETFKGKAAGELVGLFGISASLGDLDAAQSETRLALIGFSLAAALLIFIAISYFLSRFVARPLASISTVVGAIAQGDMTQRVPAGPADEFGELADHFNETVERLRGTLVHVAEAMGAVTSSASEISASTEEMAAGAQEQASQVGEVASSVEHLTESITGNARNSRLASDSAGKTTASAEQGSAVVGRTVEGMSRIGDAVQRFSATIRSLQESTGRIGGIVATIDDIADQTNLLALNAAIEAARAGDNGRGFAVVADEVRKLAERTAVATKEIAGMIARIQSDSRNAAGELTQGIAEVDSGVALAGEAGRMLDAIVELSRGVSTLVDDIASSSGKQSDVSQELAKTSDAIKTVSSQTADGLQEVARAVNDLNLQAEQVQKRLDWFTLHGDMPTRVKRTPGEVREEVMEIASGT
ncbi:MAG TPA: methyl-accepting chemotaxis protein [Bacteroidota bacterium]|nr:methyl-accepting chemotaxis protein [Bacteroidota bacterium]